MEKIKQIYGQKVAKDVNSDDLTEADQFLAVFGPLCVRICDSKLLSNVFYYIVLKVFALNCQKHVWERL